ncbi:MAG TPA: hypothetical protein VHL54_04625, partial [Actinomycetota bacterium]|nr:hypothetical protein [Actinomycetota bacterium]
MLPPGPAADSQRTVSHGYNSFGNPNQTTVAGSTAFVDYNSNGTPNFSWQPEQCCPDSSPYSSADTDKATAYSYFSNGPGAGQVPTVRPPVDAQMKPESYTYDLYGRALTFTDGRGVVTTYSYD